MYFIETRLLVVLSGFNLQFNKDQAQIGFSRLLNIDIGFEHISIYIAAGVIVS